MNEQMDRQMYGQIKGTMDSEQMDGQIDRQMNGWIDRINGKMEGYINGQMDGLLCKIEDRIKKSQIIPKIDGLI